MIRTIQIIIFFISAFFFAQKEEQNIVDLNPNQKEINKQQDFKRNYLINFLESSYNKENGFYLLTEKKIENMTSLEMSNEPTLKLSDIKKIEIIQNGKYRPYLKIYLKHKAQHKFAYLISKNIGNGIGTIVDRKIIMMTPLSKETSNVFIEIIGLYNLEEINALKSKLLSDKNIRN